MLYHSLKIIYVKLGKRKAIQAFYSFESEGEKKTVKIQWILTVRKIRRIWRITISSESRKQLSSRHRFSQRQRGQ